MAAVTTWYLKPSLLFGITYIKQNTFFFLSTFSFHFLLWFHHLILSFNDNHCIHYIYLYYSHHLKGDCLAAVLFYLTFIQEQEDYGR